jgi:beta-lactamase class A
MYLRKRTPIAWRLLLLGLLVLACLPTQMLAQTNSKGSRAAVLEQGIRAILAKSSGVWGVSVRDIEGSEWAEINADQRFPMASVFKVPVLVELYHQAQAGKISLDERVEWRDPSLYFGSGILVNLGPGLRPTIRDLATLMVIVSDNAATDQICSRVGFDRINSSLRALGIEHTRVDMGTRDLILRALGLADEQYRNLTVDELRKLDRSKLGSQIKANQKRFIDECPNCGTPREMTLLVENLASGRLADAAGTSEMLKILSNQQFNERLPRWLPYDVRVDHKTGTLLEPVWVVTDAGLIHLPGNRHIAISVFSHGTEMGLSYAETKAAISGAEERIAEIGNLVFAYFTSRGVQ